MVQEQGARVIFLDYLQLVKNRLKDGTREREVAEVSVALKELSKDLRVPIVALAQLNRGVEKRDKKRPVLADLRESGGIEQDADFVGFIHRDPANRHGPTGVINMRFVEKLTRFEEDVGGF
jgi:replicative DNA helicase